MTTAAIIIGLLIAAQLAAVWWSIHRLRAGNRRRAGYRDRVEAIIEGRDVSPTTPPSPRATGRPYISGYQSTGRHADDLTPPPAGPAPGGARPATTIHHAIPGPWFEDRPSWSCSCGAVRSGTSDDMKAHRSTFGPHDIEGRHWGTPVGKPDDPPIDEAPSPSGAPATQAPATTGAADLHELTAVLNDLARQLAEWDTILGHPADFIEAATVRRALTVAGKVLDLEASA